MKRALAFATAIAGAGIVAGSLAAFALRPAADPVYVQPAWSEIKWPFLIDQWGMGRAFACRPADCGAKVEVYVRPKIGFCNCSTGVSDDAELERVADTTLIANAIAPLGPGLAVKVGWMFGRTRLYRPVEAKGNERIVSVAFNDECDAVVAVARLAGGDPTALAPAVVGFLNRRDMVLWAKKELGLEFVKREW
jgi:hypothetical protein